MINTPRGIQQHHLDSAAKRITLIRLERDYRRLLSAASRVNKQGFHELWLDGRWGVAEIVAGHTGWLQKLDEALRLSRDGVLVEQIDWLYLEQWEEAMYVRGAGQPKGRLLRDLRRAYQEFKKTATRLPAHRYGRNGLVTRMFSYVGVCKFGLHASLIQVWSDGRLKPSSGAPVTTPGSIAA